MKCKKELNNNCNFICYIGPTGPTVPQGEIGATGPTGHSGTTLDAGRTSPVSAHLVIIRIS